MNKYDRNTILGLPDVAKDDEVASSPAVTITTNGIHNTYSCYFQDVITSNKSTSIKFGEVNFTNLVVCSALNCGRLLFTR